jgi:transcriptional regulator with XRE-family HTH domain
MATGKAYDSPLRAPRTPRTPNRVLRRIREQERCETRAEFADAMARVAGEIGEEVYPDAKYVERLESGAISWPRPPYRNILAKLCGRSIGELGFTAPILSASDPGETAPGLNKSLRDAIFASGMEVTQFARKVGVEPKSVQRWITTGRVPHASHRWKACQVLEREESELWPETCVAPGKSPVKHPPEIIKQSESPERMPVADMAHFNELEVDDVERRELLKIFGGIAVATPFANSINRLRRDLDHALNSPTTKADVEEWERVANEYADEVGRMSPMRLLPELVTDLDEAQCRLNNSSAAFRGPMARVCAQLSVLTAGTLLNAGDARNAGRYWRTALRLADGTNDPDFRALIYGHRAVSALYENWSEPAAILAIADRAISMMNSIPCEGVVSAYSARAMSLAVLGKHQESIRAAQNLSDISGRLSGITADSRSYWGWSEQQLHYVESHVYSHAGRITDAGNAQDAGLALVPGDTCLPSAQFELHKAMCLITGGDPSEGIRHIVRVVGSLPSSFRQGTTIRQTAARALHLVPEVAANVKSVSEARELLSLPRE